MNIGIIVHSQTGHTMLVGERIREKLESIGHEVSLIRMKNLDNTDPEHHPKNIKLDHIPEASGYDALIFGAWVQAFNLCSGFHLYLKQIPVFDTKNVSCFLTEHFPYRWMGGHFCFVPND
ncbi:flavodoxin family protein [Metaplanococcus flavidus]|uniref:Flavodoxin family protein n=1 Tax=Metaplanococcus flavidus TaxID=569883 RepID=A0ABW3LF65_9BACL